MMTFVRFVVDIEPRGKDRARIIRKGKHFGVKDTQRNKNLSEVIRAAAREALRKSGVGTIEGPYRVDIDAYIRRPQRLLRQKDPDGPVWAPRKPDRDNIDKLVLDALFGSKRASRVFPCDDSKVVDGRIRKMYHAKGGSPCLVVTVTGVDPLEAANATPSDVQETSDVLDTLKADVD